MRTERMSPLLALGILVAGLCSRVHCLPENVTPEEQHKVTSVDGHSLASSNTDFAFSLYKQLALKDPNKNVIFSPLSVSIALAFLSLGAHGPTVTEILEGLKFNLTETPETEIHQGFQHLLQTFNQPSNQLQLSVGNAIFVPEELKLLDKFRKDAEAFYASEVLSINFKDSEAAVKLINEYVKNKTHGKIEKLLNDLDVLTNLILLNYIFFKAQWKTPFNPNHTYESEFHVSKNERVKVPMMTLRLETPYFRDEELGCTLVELTYTSNDSALFILPDEGKMQDLEAKLTPETLTRHIDELSLPRFSISSDYQLRDILSQLGIKKIFNQRFSQVSPKLCTIHPFYRRAVLDVGEEGTEGAAVTAVIMFTSLPLHALNIKTQRIIFLGKVTNPKEA
uniref:Serpin domain-containing protein n=1 Tax=Bos indicus x Bos taurus TaxID=30522 RepID=A0A4W2BPC1_BOBOX